MGHGDIIIVLLVHCEVLVEVVDEPRGRAEAPGDVALPRGDGPLGNSVVTHLSLLLNSGREWASVVEETHVHDNLHLLCETEVEELRLGVLTLDVEPSVSGLLETTTEGGLGVGSASLNRVVWQVG